MRFKWSRWGGPALVSLLVAACGDDGSGGAEDVDASDEGQGEAGLDAQADDSNPDASTGSTLTSAGSSSRGATSASTGATALGSDASAGSTSGGAQVDAGADAGDDETESSTGVGDTTQVTSTISEDASTGSEETTESTSTTTSVTSPSSEGDGGVDATVDASGIEDPTSEEVPDPVGPYWGQTFWQGHVEPIGDTTVVTVEGEQLCFSGDESGTVGFWYNVNQAQGGSVEEFTPLDDVAGFNLDIATVGEYEIHFYSDDTLYCSGVLAQDTTFFLWDSFRECDDLLTFFDAETPLTTVRFTYDADGEFEVCLNRFESGREPDASVAPGGDASVDSDGDAGEGTLIDASVDSGDAAVDAGDAPADSGDASVDASAL